MLFIKVKDTNFESKVINKLITTKNFIFSFFKTLTRLLISCKSDKSDKLDSIVLCFDFNSLFINYSYKIYLR